MSGNFFNVGPFMPHGGCYLWTTSLIWLHAFSDGAIVAAYYSIPFTLFYFVRKRKDLEFHWIFMCFAVFVLACGTTHLMEIWNIWHANYWLSGLIKAFTAVVSVPTAFLLARLVPQALALPSTGDLRKAHDELEIRVRERTAELEKTTEKLQAEILARTETEHILRRTDRALRTISDCNQALVRATTEPALLSKICRVIVDQGGYRLACVGFAENNPAKSVRLAARAGFDEGYLDQLQLTWADTVRGQGPVGTALRTGRMAVSSDIRSDPKFEPWREAALQRGYASCIVLPLLSGGHSFGVLTIYGGVPNAFTPTEIELLTELADDLAYGIQSLRTTAEHARAQAVLQRSEQNYREIFNATNEAIFLHDNAGKILDVNDAMLGLYGYAAKAGVLSAQFSDLCANEPPYTVAEAKEYIRRAVAEGPQIFEWRARRKDGEQFWVEVSMHSSQIGGAGRILAVVRNIDERKRAQQLLVESEQRYHDLFAHMNEGFACCQMIFEAGRPVDFVYLAVNEMFVTLTGLKDVVGKRVTEVIPGIRESDPEFFAIYGRVAATGQPEKHEQYIKALQSWLELSIYSTERNLFTVVFDVITERKRAEEKMHVQLSALSAAANAIVITDHHGTIEWANPAFSKLTGFSQEETVGKTPRILKSGRNSPAFYANLWATILTGNVWHGEIINRRRDGQLYTEDTTITPVRGSDGEIAHFVAIKQDVTEQRRLEKRIQQSQKMEAIGTLAGGVAHDFNNILAAMFGYGYLLQEDTAGNPAAQENISEILKAAGRAKDLVQQILTFSRQREQKPEIIQLDSVVKEAIKFLRASLPAQIKIELNLAPGVPSVLADPTQIYQVTINLATNALHAMDGRSGQLSVSLESFLPDAKFIQTHPEFRSPSYARLTVADTGHGMDAKTLERIFEPFFTTKPVGKGTGLGLAVVHGIVQSHQGIITVDSQVGRGTTFNLYFPGQTQSAGAAVDAETGAPNGAGQRILLLDDEPALTTVLRHMLVRLNYQVTTSNLAREAVGLCRDNPALFDLVITDLTMPDLNGLEVARQIHAIRPDLPILLISGFSSTLTPEDLREAGICEIIEKPFSKPKLGQLLHHVFAKP